MNKIIELKEELFSASSQTKVQSNNKLDLLTNKKCRKNILSNEKPEFSPAIHTILYS